MIIPNEMDDVISYYDEKLKEGWDTKGRTYRIINGDTKLYLQGSMRGMMEPLGFPSIEPTNEGNDDYYGRHRAGDRMPY